MKSTHILHRLGDRENWNIIAVRFLYEPVQTMYCVHYISSSWWMWFTVERPTANTHTHHIWTKRKQINKWNEWLKWIWIQNFFAAVTVRRNSFWLLFFFILFAFFRSFVYSTIDSVGFTKAIWVMRFDNDDYNYHNYYYYYCHYYHYHCKRPDNESYF